ncbi:MAG: DNA-binding protein [Frankiales bacterium]|nr:DNA-binding protein [Frankiales bacterium]
MSTKVQSDSRAPRPEPEPSPAPPPPRRWASYRVAAEYLGVNPRTIREMTRDGRITGYGSSSQMIRVDLNEIDACMKPVGGAA